MNDEIKNYFHFIGIGGIAGSGKDLFFTLCKEYLRKLKIHTTKVSLADKLKSEVEPAIKDMYGFNLANCSRKQKDLVRSHLVFYGKVKRKQTKGRHWIEQAEKTISKLYKNSSSQGLVKPFVFVTDIRYHEYKEDETHWIKKELGGTLVHVQKFTPSPEIDKQEIPTGLFLKKWPHAPNSSEEKNDPRVQRVSDKLIKWQNYENLPLNKIKKLLSPVAKSFIDKELEKLNPK